MFKQKTAYEMRISDWSSDVCSSDLPDKAGIVIPFTQRLVANVSAGGISVINPAGDGISGRPLPIIGCSLRIGQQGFIPFFGIAWSKGKDRAAGKQVARPPAIAGRSHPHRLVCDKARVARAGSFGGLHLQRGVRSEEQTSELQYLM